MSALLFPFFPPVSWVGLTLVCVPRIIGSTIICASQNVGMLVAGRLINGFAVGIESAQVPVYVSELAKPSMRGRVVGAQQWAITWGILIMFYISYGSSFIGGDPGTATNPAAFRLPWALQMIPAFGLFFGMMALPESPRWLAHHDRWEECHAVLTELVPIRRDPSHCVHTQHVQLTEAIFRAFI